jgi:CHASE2 domain-containing protein
MTESHENEITNPSPAGNASSLPPATANSHARRKKIYTSFYISMAFTLVLYGLNLWVGEKTYFGRLFKEMTYGSLQHHLSKGDTFENSQVVVLDISGIPMVPTMGFHDENITDRKKLSQIVEDLANTTPHPASIGLDVDFSPDSRGYADPGDEKILQEFLDLWRDTKVPILVGVHRSVGLGPEKWLRDPRFINLASCVVVPTQEKGESTRSMPEWLDVNYSGTPFEGITEHCPVMGVALARLTVKSESPWRKYLVESSWQKVMNSDHSQPGSIVSNEILVDYSPLDFMAPAPEIHLNDDNTIEVVKEDGTLIKPEDGGISKLVGDKIVLLGRTKNTTDLFTVPGRPEAPFAGVYLHAAAAYTLLNETLYMLATPLRLTADLILSLAVFGFVCWIRLKNKREDWDEFFERYLPVLLAVFIVVVLILCETWLLSYTRLMWDDYIIIAIVLLVHSPIEHATERLVGLVRGVVHPAPAVPASATDTHTEGE